MENRKSVVRAELLAVITHGPHAERQIPFAVWGESRVQRAKQLRQGQHARIHVAVVRHDDGRLVNRVVDFQPEGELSTITAQGALGGAGVAPNPGPCATGPACPPEELLRRLRAAVAGNSSPPTTDDVTRADTYVPGITAEWDAHAAQYQHGFRAGTKNGARVIVDFDHALQGYASVDAASGVGEGYLSVYQYSTELAEYRESNVKQSLSGYRGQAWARWLVIDIDGGGTDADLDRTFRSASLFVDALVALGVPRASVLVFFSGCRGVHVMFPSPCFGATPREHFERVAGAVCSVLADLVAVVIDPSMYRPLASLRAPNTTHDTSGLWKVLIEPDELPGMTSDAVRQLATQPRPFVMPDWRQPPAPLLVELWGWAREATEPAPAPTSVSTTTSMERRIYADTFDLMVHGAPDGTRGSRFFRAAMNLLDFECPEDLLHALLEPAAKLSHYPLDEFMAQMNGAMKAHGSARV